MSGTEEENTRWIYVWAENDPAHHFELVEVAKGGPAALRERIEDVLKSAEPESTAWYTGREMTPGDYEDVNWKEVVATLLGVDEDEAED
jgi:hypothetical protein